METRVLMGILAAGILIFGLMLGAPVARAQNQDPERNFQNSEGETIEKINQDLFLANLSIELTIEQNAVLETIARLEIFQTDDLALQNKINNDWLPFFKEYFKILKNVQSAVERFGKRKDLISNEEIAIEFRKVYPQNTGARVKQVAEEMGASGILEKLFKN